ncbi:SAM-dependent methyltransferase [Actinomadura miaoliensis]|uniref:27-O-demethylrifamycin SV methyltransferase n=1 Tax=Actinomadura miaoliensis TaxID=430685 RepID=A0ABP7WAC0_9ACTN
MGRNEPVAARVGEYYDDIGDFVELVGGNLHVGYWTGEDDDTPLLGALHRLTSMMEERLALRPGHRLLDVGCGVAEPAVRIAQRNEVTVVGVTVSGWQVAEAERRITAAGLRGQVSVRLADAAALPFPDGSFDRVLAFDSLPNAEDKRRWTAEMFRVLRPGGRCVYSEYPRDPGTSEEELAVLKRYALFDPPIPDRVTAPAEEAGFTVVETLHCGDRVRRYYDLVLDKLARQRDALTALYGRERMEAFAADLRTSYGICRRRLGYVIVTCRKPGS